MFRILFLILILMSSFVFAQTKTKPEAKMIDEFGFIGIEEFEARFDAISIALRNDESAAALIIDYGSDRVIKRNERIAKQAISNYKIDDSRITFISGGFLKEQKTQFWIVPAGADAPQVTPLARLTDEFGKATNGRVKMLFSSFMVELQNDPTARVYIINYGTDREIAKRERQIQNAISFQKYDKYDRRITLVRGGIADNIKTQLWIVPAGAEDPKP